ncbi:unnamed protein product [Rhizopus stolonifer]
MKYISSNPTEYGKEDEKKICTHRTQEKQFSLLTMPVELQIKIFIYAQNPALAFVCQHFQILAGSNALKAQYLVYRYGSESALSERSVRRKITSLKVIDSLLNQYGCDPTADEFWLYKHACQTNQVDICKWIIQAVATSNFLATGTLLSMAATYGAIDVVNILIDNHHVDIHQPNGNERALQIATSYNQIPLVKHLCEKYECNFHVDNESFLRSASFNGFFDLVNYFLCRGAHVDAYNNASLASAVHQGHSDIVKLLLKAGAPADIHNNLWAQYASVHRQDIKTLKHLILIGGLDPRFDDDLMLIQACKKGLMDLLRFLLTEIMVKEVETIVNIKNGILLEKAIVYKQIPVLQLLLSFGADVNSYGCIRGLHHLLGAKVRSKATKEIIKLVVSRGFDMATQSHSIRDAIIQLLEKV